MQLGFIHRGEPGQITTPTFICLHKDLRHRVSANLKVFRFYEIFTVESSGFRTAERTWLSRNNRNGR